MANYRIKPTPHPSADVLRALADDKSLVVEFACKTPDGDIWVEMMLNDKRLRIKQ